LSKFVVTDFRNGFPAIAQGACLRRELGRVWFKASFSLVLCSLYRSSLLPFLIVKAMLTAESLKNSEKQG
jgi:hypothetical protein